MKPAFQAIEPRLAVTDLKASVEFYRKLFAFDSGETVMITEDDEFAILRKDKIGFQLVSQSSIHPLSPTTVWIDLAGVTALYDSIKESFCIEWGPEVYSYGRREFCVADPDKHQIIFSEAATDPATCKE